MNSKLWRWPRMAILAAIMLSGYLIGCDAHDATWLPAWQPPAALVGQWEGSLKIFNDFVQHSRVDMNLTINADGSVTGQIGDAKLESAKIAPNRGDIGRALNLATDFIVVGKLKGPLIAAEGITRDSVSIPFNLVEGKLEGGFGSDGVWFGGKGSAVISGGVKLTPMGTPTTKPAGSQK